MRKVYVHEVNHLRQARTSALYEAIESRGLPLYTKHGIELVGYWETVMGQGVWPETIAVWEFRDFGHYTQFIRDTYDPPDGDFALREWQDAKSEWIESTESLLCFGAEACPSVAELRESGTPAKLINHETISTAPNRQAEYSELLTEMWWKRCAEPAGRSLIGLYYAPWKNTRAINIWGQGEDWEAVNPWGTGAGWYETKDVQVWNTLGLEVRKDFDDRFGVPAPFSTVR
ncbi:MAG: NIPSNAP family protein [Deltaproteobacteria bacterium]|jgi:hypothetical protein|nr:NIPSNAP family protein [Deltaproteobacteria bacterium]